MNQPSKNNGVRKLYNFFEIDNEENCKEFKSLEIFMLSGYCRIEGLNSFTNLTQLSIIQQNLQRIENLSSLVNLESLWINENPLLVKIEGLSALVNLKKLSLFVILL
jgi:Leucine-rich repeat (LRR) protein